MLVPKIRQRTIHGYKNKQPGVLRAKSHLAVGATEADVGHAPSVRPVQNREGLQRGGVPHADQGVVAHLARRHDAMVPMQCDAAG
jgi:hypothetical protein